MRALSVRQPFAELIMRGLKPFEFRDQPTKVRGRVYIYACKGRYSSQDEEAILAEYELDDIMCDDLPRGVLVGTVEIFDCTPYRGRWKWHLREPKKASRRMKPKRQPQPVWFNPF